MRPSFQRHELRRSRRPDAGSAVRDRLPRHGELADVMPDHLRLDLDRHELLPVVDRDLLPRHRQDLRRFSFSRFGFGDIRPTFRPGGASYPTVDGFPTCWWDPPPCGWSTGFIATPRTLNAGLLKERYENHFLPAFVKGLSPRPAPATAPIVARQSGWNVWNCPEGSWTTVRSAWLTTTACVPAARTNFPPSPGIASML